MGNYQTVCGHKKTFYLCSAVEKLEEFSIQYIKDISYIGKKIEIMFFLS